jgi:hypothetical protein
MPPKVTGPRGMGEIMSSAGIYNGAVTASSSSRNPYLHGIYYAGDTIHVTWGWRETSSSSSNHDVCYAYSDDNGRTWHNSNGVEIAQTRTNPIRVDDPGVTVAVVPQGQGLSNAYTNYTYPDGRSHAMIAYDGAYKHHFRTAEGEWGVETLPFSGSRPEIVGDTDGNLFLVYSASGSLRLAKGTKSPTANSWTWQNIYTRTDASEMGEGLLDRARWETERVLSVFGQENPTEILDYGSGPMIDGLPAPVHVLDFHVSVNAVLPVPHHLEATVPTAVNLEWTPGKGAVGHEIYFGTSAEAVAAADKDSAEYLGSSLVAAHSVADLDASTTYYWRVRSGASR